MNKYIHISSENCLLGSIPICEAMLHFKIKYLDIMWNPNKFLDLIKKEYPSATRITIIGKLHYQKNN